MDQSIRQQWYFGGIHKIKAKAALKVNGTVASD